MQAVKVGWIGQTFALAKCNDSQGKKPRTRRTKEERRAMVESFIKKYRTSNNGNFPSLNLTHKEVGGSFYTVREIVREIIQENRVLGPAGVSLEEQHPSGSLSREPQGHLSMSPETCNAIASNQQDILVLSSEDDGYYKMVESKDMETLKSHPNPCIPNEYTAYQHKSLSLNGILVGEHCKDAWAWKQSKMEQLGKQEDELDHMGTLIGKKPETVEHFVELSADTAAHTLSNAQDRQTHNGESHNIYKAAHPPDLPQLSSTRKDNEIGELIDSIDHPTTFDAVDNAVRETVASKISPEAKIVTNVEISNMSLPTVEQPSPAYVRGAFPYTSAASLATCPDATSEAERANVGNLNSESGGFHESGRDLTCEILSQRTNDLSKDGDIAVSHSDDLMLEAYEENSLVAETELQPQLVPTHSRAENVTVNANDICEESALLDHDTAASYAEANLKHNIGSCSENFTVIADKACQEPASPVTNEAVEVNTEATLKHNSSTGEGRKSTPADMSSGSGEKATEKSAEVYTNPVWAVIKAFISAFVRFWVE